MKLTTEKLKIILGGVASIGTLLVLVFSLFALHATDPFNPLAFRSYFALIFLALAISRIPMVIQARKFEPNRLVFYKQISFSIIFLVLFFIVAIFGYSNRNNCFVAFAYLAVIVVNRILLIVEKKKISTTIFNIFLAVLTGSLMIIALTASIEETDEIRFLLIEATLLIVMFFSILETLVFAFSRIKLKGLLKIMQKTYAFEILYGLIILIVAFSVYFMIMEEEIATFGDGLWYSFAVVTTIGFGDLKVTSAISRLFSVILGIYGIIVVAVLTSIIVNFYNESKENQTKKDEEKDPEEIEEELDDKKSN